MAMTDAEMVDAARRHFEFMVTLARRGGPIFRLVDGKRQRITVRDFIIREAGAGAEKLAEHQAAKTKEGGDER